MQYTDRSFFEWSPTQFCFGLDLWGLISDKLYTIMIHCHKKLKSDSQNGSNFLNHQKITKRRMMYLAIV